MKNICYIILLSVLAGCASKPLLEKSDVKLTRDEAAKDCQGFGSIEVKSLSTRPDQNKLMDELKEEARKKGANFVKVEGLGAQGTSVRGQAYACP